MGDGNSFGQGEPPCNAPIPVSHGSKLPLSTISTPYYTIEEAAAYLRMEKLKTPIRQIQRMVQLKKLKAYRNGRNFLFTKEQMDDYLRFK